ncbi:MAG TPA: TIGR01777 family protein [Saprospiraceae bacterium]|nr:TIGR01777 family protein [Saprospiraceae bacterium]
MKHNVLITGGTGFIGKELAQYLIANGHQVAILTRRKKEIPFKQYLWDIEKGEIDPEAIEFSTAIIHLAGENISARRWSKMQKRKIVRSRIQSTILLYKSIASAKKKPSVIISASAVGYYGAVTGDDIFTEESPQGQDFLAETVGKWEKEMLRFSSDLGIRTAILRLGVVFSPNDGALKKMLLPLKFGFAAPIGKGRNYIPWISIHDLMRLFVFALENKSVSGIYNATSPTHFTNRELMKEIAQIKHKFFIPFGVPAFLLKLVFGEMSCVILEGSRVSSKKIRQSGFSFDDELADIF